MSNAVLKGNASGTGTVTLETPDTNSDFTISLPAANGSVILAGTTPTLNGITFPATQVPSADANTLDDYEEGTWTPSTIAYGPGSSVPTFTSFTSSGSYTKIGRQVFLTGVISWTGRSGGAGLFGISGLPFNISPHTMQSSMEFDQGFGASLGVAEAIKDAGLQPRTFLDSAVPSFKFGYASSGGTNVTTDLSCTSLLNTTVNFRFALNYIV
jgi:hypothetical protein